VAAGHIPGAEPNHGSAEFTVVVRDLRGVTDIEVAGELDLSRSPTFQDAMVALDLDGGLEVQMNLTQLTFLDSSGLGLIVSVCKRVRGSGGTFSVTCDDPMIRRTLEIAGLTEYLRLNEALPAD
jgi:anti-sigma B factor antagonist